MRLISQTFSLDGTSRVRITTETVRDHGDGPTTSTQTVTYARGNGWWLANALACQALDERAPRDEHRAERDALAVYGSGSEMSPYVNIENRPGGGPLEWIAIAPGTARALALAVERLPWTGTDADEAEIAEFLLSGDPDDITDALNRLGKQRHRALAPLAAPFLGHANGSVRAYAIRALGFHLAEPAFRDIAVRLLHDDPDEEVRSYAAMSVGTYARQDSAYLPVLLDVILDGDETDWVRGDAFAGALAAAGVKSVLGLGTMIGDFDALADWRWLARALTEGGFDVPEAIRARAADAR